MVDLMPEENKEQGESMEGILKSIKNIISGELDKNGAPANASQANPANGQADEEILELTNKVSTPAATHIAEVKPAPAPVEAAPRGVLENIDEVLGANKKEAAEPGIAPPAPQPKETAQAEKPPEKKEEPVAQNQNPTPETLLSEQAAKSAEESFKGLMKSVPKPHFDSPAFRSGQTLEDLVIESLKPMMADWLNSNLPVIVKQIVEKEVRKIVPRD